MIIRLAQIGSDSVQSYAFFANKFYNFKEHYSQIDW